MESNDPKTLFANGLYDMLKPAVTEVDDSIRGVFNSQKAVLDQLEGLSEGIYLISIGLSH